MPRRSNFKYQIDRRRDKTNREKDEQEEAFLNADDDEQEASNDEEDDYEYEEKSSHDEEYNDSNDDDDSDHDKAPAKTNRKASTSRARNTRRSSQKPKWNQEGEDDDDDDEDHRQKNTKRATVPSRGKRKLAPSASSSEESEPEWPGEKDDPDDEDFVLPSGKSSKAKNTDDDKNSVADSDEDDLALNDKPAPSRKRNTTTTSRGSAKRRRRVHDSDDDDDDDDDDDIESLDKEDEEFVLPPQRPRRAGRKSKSSPPPGPPRRNLRGSTTRGINRPSYKEKDSDEDVVETDEDTELVAMTRKSQRSGRKKAASAKTEPQDEPSDEEFLADSASEKSDEKEIFFTDSEDEEGEEEIRPRSTKSKPIDIDGDEIGSAGFSSDGDDHKNDTHKHGNKSNKRKSAKEIQPISRDVSNDDDDSSFDEDAAPSLNVPPRLPTCPSVDDAITLEPLPRIHVCYVSPDGLSRQCFSLETLRQIALNSNNLPFRVDLDGSTKDTFLQPPHFRTAMSDDLLDQIASRFGREALDLHGEFYNLHSEFYSRPSQNALLDNDDDDVNFNEAIFGTSGQQSGSQLIDHVQRYMTNQMGSRDVYACPLCYSEVHRRIVHMDRRKPGRRTARNNYVGDEEKIDDDEFLQLPPDSSYDPMTVLGWLDNDRFETSSFFCFSKVADLKQHLREDHEVMTKDVEGNDLYQRFRVRGQDGLLQRYLHNQWKRIHANSFQGAMQIYWFQGNNQSYVYFLEQIKRAQFFMGILKADDADDVDFLEAEDYVKGAHTFFRSFQNRAHLDWDLISSPFAKSSQKNDLKDFLAEDDFDEQNEEQTPAFLAHRQLHGEDDDSDPNDLVNKLQRKYVENYHDDFSSGIDDNSEIDEDYEEEVSLTLDLKRKGYYSDEEEEDDDDWVASIRQKRQKKPSKTTRKTKAPSKTSHATPVGRKLTRRKNTTPTTGTTVSSQPTPTSQRRRIAEESNSEADE